MHILELERNTSRSQALLMFFLIVIVNRFFYLLPENLTRIHGIFNILDIGLALLLISLFFILLTSKKLNILSNVLSWMVFFYLLIVSLQITLAGIYYNQKILTGIIGARHQLYYLSFFLFLLLLDNLGKIRRFLDSLLILAILIIGLSILNYFGPVIFHHEWAEGHGIRSGITRAFIPGDYLISFVTLWQFSKLLGDNRDQKINGVSFMFLVGAHFFRQTRSRIIALLIVIVLMIWRTRNLKTFLIATLISLLVIGMNQIFMTKNIFVDSITTAVTDVEEEEGTWVARIRQSKAHMEMFAANPILGTGLSTTRQGTTEELQVSSYFLRYASKNADLGYSYWLQADGLIGAIWLILFLSTLWLNSTRLVKKARQEEKALALFTVSYVEFVAVSFITMPHLIYADGIIMVCLTMVIIIRLQEKTNQY